MEFEALKRKHEEFKGLEVFPTPAFIRQVTMTSTEVTSLCPITGNPDYYSVEIKYVPRLKCVESKSLKLYFNSFRTQGQFCEDFARAVLEEVWNTIEPNACRVVVTQIPRGGIAIEAVAEKLRENANLT